MTLLALISWPYVKRHLLRSVLTVIGIAMGVALYVAMQTANQTVLQSFSQTVDRIAGKAQLQISAGETGFSEDVLEKVQSLPEVRVAAPIIEAKVDTGLKGQGLLLILAVDMAGDGGLRDYDFENSEGEVTDDPLVFLAQPDSLIIAREFAKRNGLSSGSKLRLETMEGFHEFTIRGILQPAGMAQAFDGNLGIMDIYAAQKIFGRGRRFDRIDIGLKEGTPVLEGQAALRAALGSGFDVGPPASRGRQFEDLLGVYLISMNVSSLFALFIGMFIIYNSFAIAVTQRRYEIGVLRALGATRGQVRTLFLIESAIAGLMGSLLGIVVGLALAQVLTDAISSLLGSLYGVVPRPDQIFLRPADLLLVATGGVVISIIAGLIPARNAARTEPIQALQKGKYQVIPVGEGRLRRGAALLALAIAAVCIPFAAHSTAFYLGYFMVLLAALLLAPFLALAMARLLRKPLKWIRPVEGALAADSIIQSPRRTSATVTALMLSLALVIGQGGVALGSHAQIQEWIETALNPDIFVSTSPTWVDREFHFPAAMGPELETIEGIQAAVPVRTVRGRYRNGSVMIIATDLESLGARVHRTIIAGDHREMHSLAAEGKGVIISDNFAQLQKLGMGDPVELETPAGAVRLPVVGVVRDFSDQVGNIFLDRRSYLRYYGDDTVDIFRVYLKPGVAATEVRRRINERFSGQRRFFVLLNAEVKASVTRVLDRWMGMTYIQILVAVLVAILGIVNTLTVSITDRRREFAVLRAAGALRMQVRKAVWMEALAIGFIGLVLGLGVGAIQLYGELEVIRRDVTGMALGYHFPVEVALLLAPLILGAAFVSALGPAERAVRASLVEALEYE